MMDCTTIDANTSLIGRFSLIDPQDLSSSWCIPLWQCFSLILGRALASPLASLIDQFNVLVAFLLTTFRVALLVPTMTEVNRIGVKCESNLAWSLYTHTGGHAGL